MPRRRQTLPALLLAIPLLACSCSATPAAQATHVGRDAGSPGVPLTCDAGQSTASCLTADLGNLPRAGFTVDFDSGPVTRPGMLRHTVELRTHGRTARPIVEVACDSAYEVVGRTGTAPSGAKPTAATPSRLRIALAPKGHAPAAVEVACNGKVSEFQTSVPTTSSQVVFTAALDSTHASAAAWRALVVTPR